MNSIEQEVSLVGNDWSRLVPVADYIWEPSELVSVCIPCQNPTTNLDRVLDALAMQTYPQHLIEVIVADDGSESPINLETRTGEVRVVRLEPTEDFGAGRARNAAARAARGTILLFLDADVVPEIQVVECYARWFERRRDVVPMGLLRFVDMDDLDTDTFHQIFRDQTVSKHFNGRDVDDQDWRENTFRRTHDLTAEAVDAFRIMIGATFAVATEQYWNVGGFRELGVRGVEDTELGYRLHCHGLVLILDRDAGHWHQGERNMTQSRKSEIRQIRGPYVSGLIPVKGFRSGAPKRVMVPVETVPRCVVLIEGAGEPFSGTDPTGRICVPDDCVVTHDPLWRMSEDEMPFVPSFAQITVSRAAVFSVNTVELLVELLYSRNVGMAIVGSSGSDKHVTIRRTRAIHRARTNPADDLDTSIAQQFGVWHSTPSTCEISWATDVDGTGSSDR